MNIKDNILANLINKQRDIQQDKKLTFSDLKRLSSNLNNDIFGTECSIWNGYITNLNNEKKCYISFFFKSKKVALHRLLYINFINDLSDNDYLKFTCENKGKCCTLSHLNKFCLETSNKYYIENKKIKEINKSCESNKLNDSNEPNQTTNNIQNNKNNKVSF